MNLKALLFMAGAFMILTQTVGCSEKYATVDPKIIPVKTMRPEEEKVYPIAIIGAGAAGTMAVQRAVLNNNEALLFAGATQERRRSRGNWVRQVDNVPGLARYNRAVLELRNEVLEELVNSPLSQNLYVIEDSVISIEKQPNFFKLTDGSGHFYNAQFVVMATGIMDEQPLIQGSIRPILKYSNAQTVAYCLLCDGHRCVGKKTVIIGHTETAGCAAVYLVEQYPLENMAILTNGQKHEFSPELLKCIQSQNIQIYETSIQEICGNEELRQLTGFTLETGELIDADMGFVALGIRPNNQLALQLGIQVDKRGLVITDSNGETSVPNLFVVGDLRSNSMKQIYTAWQHAVESIQLINNRIRR